MNSFDIVRLTQADRLDEHLAAAAFDIIGQVNCTLYMHVRKLFTKHRYHLLQKMEISRIERVLAQKLYINFSNDAKALYIDRYYIESLMGFVRKNPVNYEAGNRFLSEMTQSVYAHLFTQEDREWVAQQTKTSHLI